MQTIEDTIKAAVRDAVREVLAEQQAAPAIPKGPPSMSVKEAAAIVGVSVPVMYEISHRDDFPACLTVGRKRVILRHKLFEWMERQAGGGVNN